MVEAETAGQREEQMAVRRTAIMAHGKNLELKAVRVALRES